MIFSKKTLSNLSIWAGRFWRKTEAIVSSNIFLKITLVWFVFQASYIAISMARGVGPDETHHLQLIKLFSEHSISPILSDQKGYYFLGEVVRSPFTIYHYFLSFPYRIFGESAGSLLFLRLINVGMGLGSLCIVSKIAQQLRLSKFILNLSVFMMSNTLMFIFLSATVNYDNLFNLTALYTTYLLLLLSKKVTIQNTILLVTTISLGVLIKINYLPIAVISAALLLYFIWLEHRSSTLTIKSLSVDLRNKRKTILLLCLPMVILSVFGMSRYSSNLISYNSVSPDCKQVLPLSKCIESPVYKRGVDRRAGGVPVNVKIGTLDYIGQWSSIMRDRIFGILSHKKMPPSRLIASWSQIILLIGIVGSIRYLSLNNKQKNTVFLIIFFYTFILALDRYKSYHKTGIIDLAVQGRYLFSVLPLIYLIFNDYTFKLFKDVRLKLVFTLLTLFVFATAGLPSFIIGSGPSWYTTQTKELNTHLNIILVHINNLL